LSYKFILTDFSFLNPADTKKFLSREKRLSLEKNAQDPRDFLPTMKRMRQQCAG